MSSSAAQPFLMDLMDFHTSRNMEMSLVLRSSWFVLPFQDLHDEQGRPWNADHQ